MTIRLDGADDLRSSAKRAAAQVDQVVAEFGDAAGPIVLSAVKPPIRTGTLASTVHAVRTDQGFAIAAGGDRAPYVAIVNARHPFIAPAFLDKEAEVLNTAAAATERLLGTIQGA